MAPQKCNFTPDYFQNPFCENQFEKQQTLEGEMYGKLKCFDPQNDVRKTIDNARINAHLAVYGDAFFENYLFAAMRNNTVELTPELNRNLSEGHYIDRFTIKSVLNNLNTNPKEYFKLVLMPAIKKGDFLPNEEIIEKLMELDFSEFVFDNIVPRIFESMRAFQDRENKRMDDVYDPQLESKYKKADLLLIPNHRESFQLVYRYSQFLGKFLKMDSNPAATLKKSKINVIKIDEVVITKENNLQFEWDNINEVLEKMSDDPDGQIKLLDKLLANKVPLLFERLSHFSPEIRYQAAVKIFSKSFDEGDAQYSEVNNHGNWDTYGRGCEVDFGLTAGEIIDAMLESGHPELILNLSSCYLTCPLPFDETMPGKSKLTFQNLLDLLIEKHGILGGEVDFSLFCNVPNDYLQKILSEGEEEFNLEELACYLLFQHYPFIISDYAEFSNLLEKVVSRNDKYISLVKIYQNFSDEKVKATIRNLYLLAQLSKPTLPNFDAELAKLENKSTP